jgi:hypothetical protein
MTVEYEVESFFGMFMVFRLFGVFVAEARRVLVLSMILKGYPENLRPTKEIELKFINTFAQNQLSC